MDKFQQQSVQKKKYRQKFFNIKDGYNLVKFINKIPNLQQIKFRLSEEQCDVVGQKENLIVIGRSGTGKTTCALMRMFSIEIIYKNSKAKQRHIAEGNSEQYHCQSKYIDEIYGIRNIFLTASPFLIKDIRSKYEDLKSHLKIQLDIAKMRHVSDQSNSDRHFISQKRFGLSEILNAQNNERIRQTNYKSFHSLTQSDFPGFFTIKEFLVMLDGILVNSFFLRDKDRFRITNPKDVEIDVEKKMYKIKLNEREYFAKECKWETFLKQFWNEEKVKESSKQKKRYLKQQQKEKSRDITAIAVWTEILTTIKGQFSSHRYPQKYLPLDQYIKQSKNKYYSKPQKQVIYQVFLNYETWKNSPANKYYDFLDLVNHLFANIEQFFEYENFNHIFYQNKPVEFNYLFLDEVQDLPSVVPYFISQLFTDGLYFAGDSAQSIQKGIVFKFADLKLMFHKEFPYPPLFFEKPEIHALTVNFRSHEKILQLANSLTKMLENLFPSSIDRMKKEQSNMDGPKPIYLNFECEETIKYLLADSKTGKLGTDSVIIVRNHEMRKSLPKNLSDLEGLVFTVQQSKGMEFKDVIMYNFFDPKLKGLWKILKYLEMYPKQGVKQFRLQEINLEDYTEIITEIKLIYTLVTRAKCSLIIYELNLPNELLLIWKNLKLIYTHDDLLQMKKQKDQYEVNYRNSVRQISWEERGYQLYMKKQYELALQCYQKSGEGDVCKNIKGIILFQSAQLLLKKLRQKYLIEKYESKYTDEELSLCQHYKLFQQLREKNVNPKFEQAGAYFAQIKLYVQAGHCFYLINDYEKAMTNYQQDFQQENSYKIGYCYQKVGQKIIGQKQRQFHFQKAAEYYKKSKKYPEMIEVLQKLNDYKLCISVLQTCQFFPERQMYFRKYAHLVINKVNYNKIDKVRKNLQFYIDFEVKPFSQSILFQEQINFFFCETQLNKINENIESFYSNKPVLCSQFKKQILITLDTFIQQTQIKSNRVLSRQLYERQIDDQKLQIKKSLSAIKENQRYVQIYKDYKRRSKADKILEEQIKIVFSHQQIDKIEKQLQKIDQQIHQIELNQQNQYKKTQKKINQFTHFFLDYLTSKYFSIDQMKQILQITNTKQIVRSNYQVIFQNITSQLEKLSIESNSILISLNNLSNFIEQFIPSQKSRQNLKNFKLTYIQPALNNIQNKIKVILDEYKLIYRNTFYHLINQQSRRLLFQPLERVYSTNNPYSYIFISEDPQHEEKERKILNEVIEEYGKLYYNSFETEQILSFSQRKQKQNSYKNLSKFKFITHISIEKQKSDSKQEKQILFSFLNKLQNISPRAVIGMSMISNFKEKAVQALISQISYYSTCYKSKQPQIFQIKEKILGKKMNEKSKKNNQFRLIKMINPLFFNFSLYRTKYRLENSGNELIEGVTLLGLHEQFKHLYSKELNLKISIAYMNEQRINLIYKQIMDQNKYYGFKDELINEEYSFKLIDQFIQMDSCQQNSWCYQGEKYLIQKLSCKQIIQFAQKQAQNIEMEQLKCLQNENQLLIYQIKRQIEREIQYRQKNYSQFQVNQLKYYNDYDKIRNETKFADVLNFYKKQIDIYKIVMELYRIRTYETFNSQNSSVYQVYHKEINNIFEGIQKINMENEEDYCQLKSQIQDLKYTILQNPIKTLLQKLVKKCIKLCKRQFQKNEAFAEFRADILSHLQNITKQHSNNKSSLQLIYKQLRQDPNYQNFIKDKKQYQDNIQLEINKNLEKFEKFKRQIERKPQQIYPRKKYLQQKFRKSKILSNKYSQLSNSNFIEQIFLSQDPTSLMNEFNNFCNIQNGSINSKFNRIKLLLVYFSYWNYNRLFEIVNDHPVEEQLSLFKENIQKVTNSLMNPLGCNINLLLFCNVLDIFKVKLIVNIPFMSIFENMVIVGKKSVLLKSQKFNLKDFVYYYPEESGQTYLMRLDQISSFISQNILKFKNSQSSARFPMIKNDHLLHLQYLVDGKNEENTFEIPKNASLIVKTIQEKKEQLLAFYYKNVFVSHQSCQFVYHQLKSYYDLTIMMRLSKKRYNILLERHVNSSVNDLSEEFQRWKKYAKNFEIYKRISRHE